MNRDSNGADAIPIDLAQEPVFTLGHMAIAPSALSVSVGEWTRRLEPRVMQALVVLARASPVVVGRGELNRRVWGGRVVGDDAINRVVQTLRRIAAAAPPPLPFRIETIPRVGYRLTPVEAGMESVGPIPDGPDRTRSADRPRGAPRRQGIPKVARWGLAMLVVLAGFFLVRHLVGRDAAPAAWRVTGSTLLEDLPPGASDAIVSPDGRRLAYRARDAGGRERIFVRAFQDGGAGMAMSPPDIDAHHPAWSPNSADLAFAGYEEGRPCRLYVMRRGKAVTPAGLCETARDPNIAWSADGRSLLLGDAPGENAVPRISAIDSADGQRTVLSSPPGDSVGDALPMPFGKEIAFQRRFGWADEGWIAKDPATGRERLLWRRHGVAGSIAVALPDGALAVAWTEPHASGLDVVGVDGRVRSEPIALGIVTAMSAAGNRLLVQVDRSETMLIRATDTSTSPPLATVRGRMAALVQSADGRLRFPVTAAGVARIWERDPAGALRQWGSLVAQRIVALSASPDGRLTAALAMGSTGREIVVLSATGRPVFRWNPHARSLNGAAWSRDGRHLIVPLLDGSGWRLMEIDPFTGRPPRDLGLPGYAVVLNDGPALYAVRAGETTGMRELWRLDGRVRRLPIDLTLFDIVNWRPIGGAVWLPDRSDRDRPRLVLREADTGRVLRSLAAPGLAGAGFGIAADAAGPLYVRIARDAPEYGLLTLSPDG